MVGVTGFRECVKPIVDIIGFQMLIILREVCSGCLSVFAGEPSGSGVIDGKEGVVPNEEAASKSM